MKSTGLEKRVLEHVNRPNYRPVKLRDIARQLRLPKDQHSELRRTIKGLVQTGQLIYGANHLVQGVGQSGRNQVAGKFRRHPSGFGFVRPLGTQASAGRLEDVFIPARKTKDAADGDTVLVHFSRRRSKERGSRVAGEIVRVISRSTDQFVGTYLESAGMGLVEVDAGAFAQPVYVGDPGAKGVRPGDKVVIQMVRFPSAYRHGEAVIIEVLGKRGAPGVDTQVVLRQFSLPEGFDEDVLQQVRRQAEQFDETELDGRADLTGHTVITIDPADARDFDDAISLERIDHGHWRLGVHIADVAHFVTPKSPLDRAARQRGTSVYLPDRVIPMLPELVSNHLASLQPNRVRYTKSVFIEYTPDGARVAAEFCSSAIRSRRRFTYEEVDDFLEHPRRWHQKLDPPVFQLLERMHELAMMLRQRRLARGAIELVLPEVKLELDQEGRVSGAQPVDYTVSHQIIEEFMLAANEAVAEELRDHNLHFLRRVHEPPDPRKLQTLTDFVRALDIPARNLENRFEIIRVLADVANRPERHAVNYAVLRSMQKAIYSPHDAGHYALASDCYCHFTSPIRRYPDLTVHRLLDAVLRGRPPVQDFHMLTALGEHCSEREQVAEAAEREAIKVKLLGYLANRVGQPMDAVITGVEDFGVFAQGIELPAEGFIPVDSLGSEHFDYHVRAHSLVGRRGTCFRLGDRIRVEIAHVDVDRRELDFRYLAHLPHGTIVAPRLAGKRKTSRQKTSTSAIDAKRTKQTKKAMKTKKAMRGKQSGRGKKPPVRSRARELRRR